MRLEYIVAVADLRGFRRAAEACRTSRSPHSHAGRARRAAARRRRIFERDRRGVRLSTVGAAIVEQARRVLVAARDLRELARQSSDPFDGTMRRGVIPTIGPYLLPDITPALARAFPRLQLLWTEARTGNLIHDLKEGNLDGVLLALEADIGDLESRVIGRDRFVLAASPRHPLVKGRLSTRADVDVLNGQTVLLLDDGHCFREQAVSFCTQASAGEHSFRATSLGGYRWECGNGGDIAAVTCPAGREPSRPATRAPFLVPRTVPHDCARVAPWVRRRCTARQDR